VLATALTPPFLGTADFSGSGLVGAGAVVGVAVGDLACSLEEAGAGVEALGQASGGDHMRPLLKEGPSTFTKIP